jgi:hypothetical protein
MKIWITKWATTQGIIEAEAEENSGYPGVVQVLSNPAIPGSMAYYLHGEGKDWCRTEYDALEVANKMCGKKIEALKRQGKTLEMKQAVMRNRRDAIRNQA